MSIEAKAECRVVATRLARARLAVYRETVSAVAAECCAEILPLLPAPEQEELVRLHVLVQRALRLSAEEFAELTGAPSATEER